MLVIRFGHHICLLFLLETCKRKYVIRCKWLLQKTPCRML